MSLRACLLSAASVAAFVPHNPGPVDNTPIGGSQPGTLDLPSITMTADHAAFSETHLGPSSCPQGAHLRCATSLHCYSGLEPRPCSEEQYVDHFNRRLVKRCSCVAGTAPTADEPVGCNPGTYGFASFCSTCPAGRFTPARGKRTVADCMPCPAGSASAVKGAASCPACPPHHYSTPDGTACTPLCAAGTYVVRAAEKSEWKPAGSCAVCPNGKYSSSAGWGACHDCALGKSPNAAATTCTDTAFVSCKPGSYNVGWKCAACPEGQYQDLDDQYRCTACQVGTYSAAKGATHCLPCGHNRYMPVTGGKACTECARATVADTSRTTCVQGCKAGEYGNPLQTVCYACADGHVQPDPAQTSCSKCQLGMTHSHDRTKCEQIVTQCSAGKYKNGNTINSVEICVDCPPGRFGAGNNGAGGCTSCPSSKFQPYAGKAACFGICPPGSMGVGPGRDTEGKACDQCAAGRYQFAAGATFCRACAKGTTSSRATRFESCTPTLPPTPAPTPAPTPPTPPTTPAPTHGGTKVGGSKCAAGRFLSKGWGGFWTECIACEPGTYSNLVVGTSHCRLCPKGYFCEADGCSQCQACPASTAPSVHRTKCVAQTDAPTPAPTISPTLRYNFNFEFLLRADHTPDWSGFIVIQRDGRFEARMSQYATASFGGEWSIGSADGSHDSFEVASHPNSACALRLDWDKSPYGKHGIASELLETRDEGKSFANSLDVVGGSGAFFKVTAGRGSPGTGKPPTWFSEKLHQQCYSCTLGRTFHKTACPATCLHPHTVGEASKCAAMGGAAPKPGCMCPPPTVFDPKSQACIPANQCACAKPVAPANGFVDTDYLAGEIGAVARYTCGPGFVRVGSAVRSCAGGVMGSGWTGRSVTCVADLCANAPDTDHGVLNDLATDDKGVTTAIWRCSVGYALLGLRGMRSCQNGNWDAAPIQCVKSCGAPATARVNSAMHLGSVFTTGSAIAAPTAATVQTTVGAEVNYVCDTGWRPKPVDKVKPETQVFCLASGAWSAPAPECEPATCAQPPTVAGASFTTDRNESDDWAYGTVVQYKCAGSAGDGVTMVGNKALQCLGEGTWGTQRPSCVKIKPCKALKCRIDSRFHRILGVHGHHQVVQTLHHDNEENGDRHRCQYNPTTKECTCLCYHKVVAPIVQNAAP